MHVYFQHWFSSYAEQKQFHFICLIHLKCFLSFTCAAKFCISSHLLNVLDKLNCCWVDLHRSPPRGRRHREGSLAQGWAALLKPRSRKVGWKQCFIEEAPLWWGLSGTADVAQPRPRQCRCQQASLFSSPLFLRALCRSCVGIPQSCTNK